MFECWALYLFWFLLYNRINKTCLLAEGNFNNCKIASNTVCENCNTNFYINQKDHLCYSNQEKNDYYKCEISNGDYCIQCINEYFLGESDHKCSTVQYCDVTENENRCLVCSIYIVLMEKLDNAKIMI